MPSSTLPPRQRNRFIADLTAEATARQDNELARIADAVTEEERDVLRGELDAWERTTVCDGLGEPTRTSP